MNLMKALFAAKLAGPGSGGGAELFVITLTETDGSYSADKTAAEIRAAINTGKDCEVHCNSDVAKISYDDGEDVLFSFVSGTSTSPKIVVYGLDGSNDTWSRKVYEWTSNGFANRSEPNGEITISGVTVYDSAYINRPITKLNLRKLTGLNTRAFEGCTSLQEVSMHTGYFSMGQNIFISCTALEKATVVYGNSNFGDLKTGFFSGCTHLEAVDLGQYMKNLNEKCFYNCAALQTIILRRSEGLVALNNSNIFTGTRAASGGAGITIYIPKALYDHLGDGSNLDYKAATLWSTFDGYGTLTWAKLEGSAYETEYLDGLPV